MSLVDAFLLPTLGEGLLKRLECGRRGEWGFLDGGLRCEFLGNNLRFSRNCREPGAADALGLGFGLAKTRLGLAKTQALGWPSPRLWMAKSGPSG